MAITTPNREIACTPFPGEALQPQRLANGLVLAASKTALVSLTALAANVAAGIEAGDIVHVRTDYAYTNWGKTKYTAKGIEGEFILVPLDNVSLVSR